MSTLEQKKPIALSLDGMKRQAKLRSKDSYKGDFEHALLVGGDAGFSGSICLASEVALRVGGSRISVATRTDCATIVTTRRPEVMAHSVSELVNEY